MIIHGIEIKPGMILYGSRENKHITLVAIPYGTDSVAFVNLTEGGWSSYYSTFLYNIEKIRDLPKDDSTGGGDILWEKPKEILLL